MNDDSGGLAVVGSRRTTDKILTGLTDEIPSKRQTCIEKVVKLLAEKCKKGKTAIWTHPCPDPDAIGSMMGLAWLIRKSYDAEVDCFYDGHVSHPQNQRMCNLLDPELNLFDKYKPEDYALRVCVDTVPGHCASSITPAEFDLVVDHHKEIPNGGFKGIFLNLRAGSCCATVYQLIKAHGLHFEEDNDLDSKVATALMVGIITDTEFQTSDDTTDFEHDAYRELFEFRNANALKQIIRYKHPKEWVEARSRVAMKAHDRIKDGILIHGIGFIDAGNRDLVAAVADEMLSWENVETAVSFAVIDGNRIEGSVRTGNAAIAVPTLCKELGGAFGGGGGKLNKGAYHYTLGSCAIDPEMDESTKEKMWEFLIDRETKRIYKAIRK
jgi:nanoRNase/pAp phosphatase (c-di-AMP/oligoRNAs hydrolase)